MPMKASGHRNMSNTALRNKSASETSTLEGKDLHKLKICDVDYLVNNTEIICIYPNKLRFKSVTFPLQKVSEFL